MESYRSPKAGERVVERDLPRYGRPGMAEGCWRFFDFSLPSQISQANFLEILEIFSVFLSDQFVFFDDLCHLEMLRTSSSYPLKWANASKAVDRAEWGARITSDSWGTHPTRRAVMSWCCFLILPEMLNISQYYMEPLKVSFIICIYMYILSFQTKRNWILK